MVNIGGNGGDKNKKPFGDEQVKFPVSYDLKVILDNNNPVDDIQKAIEKVLKQHKVSFTDFRSKLSSNDKYISFTVSVSIASHEQMTSLYESLKSIPGIKLAL